MREARPGGPAPTPTPQPLPAAARQVVDQAVRDLIQQLQGMQDRYMADLRPEDAANIRAQIRLLQRAAGLSEDAPRPDVVNMAAYRDRLGQTFMFTITGSADAPVWGSGIYTDDTPLEGAAVHAGVLRSGQTGPVRVTVLGGQQQYVGTKRNGIESSSFGAGGGSYRIETGSGTASRPTSLANFRGRYGETVTIPALGTVGGSVWGSDVYTDDSSLGAAVVHAGLLRPGEFGFVKVTILGGLGSYPGSTRNGVASQPYGEWQGSFKLEKAPQPWIMKLPDDVIDATGMIALPSLRGQGASFSLKVLGAAGPVRGTQIYTDDSSIAAAAVHSGALRLGESGYVRVTVLSGQQSYQGSDQNGVKSGDAERWLGSFRIDR
jgi:hypothetical protein